MENYKPITVNNKDYYLVNDIYDHNELFFYSTANNIRNIISKKKISNEDYIFAYTKKGQLIISHGGYCKAKLYLSLEWCKSNVPYFDKEREIVTEYDKLPPIKLLGHQKLKDDNGTEYSLMIRGNSMHYDECYFKASDVGELFRMKNIRTTLLDSRGKYKKNKHYKILYCTNKTGKRCKSIYLTYIGLMKVIFVSKNINLTNNEMNILKFINDIIEIPESDKYNINIITTNITNKGIFYLVEPNLLTGVKIGYWRGTIENLYNRYQTSYGKNMTIYYGECEDCIEMEKDFINNHQQFNITNEIYEKNKLDDYIKYMKDKNMEVLIYDNVQK